MSYQNNMMGWRRMDGSRGTHIAKNKRDEIVSEIRVWLVTEPSLTPKAVAEKYTVAQTTARLYLHEAKGLK